MAVSREMRPPATIRRIPHRVGYIAPRVSQAHQTLPIEWQQPEPAPDVRIDIPQPEDTRIDIPPIEIPRMRHMAGYIPPHVIPAHHPIHT